VNQGSSEVSPAEKDSVGFAFTTAWAAANEFCHFPGFIARRPAVDSRFPPSRLAVSLRLPYCAAFLVLGNERCVQEWFAFFP